MSREIKFRCWSEKEKAYLDGPGRFLWVEHDDTTSGLYSPTDLQITLEQYTGLKDKNGKEIYEGDILWWEHFYGMTGENIETTAKVYWEEKDASFVVGDWFEPLGHLIDEDEVEVIGNIHEKDKLVDSDQVKKEVKND